MAWPPAAYPLGTSNTNNTPSANTHPQLHNDADQSINDIVAKILTIASAGRYVVSPRAGEAQYTATGTNDHVVINQALTDAANFSTHSGQSSLVILMEGTYNCAGQIVLPDQPNVGLRGMGRGKTVLQFNLSSTVLVGRSSPTGARYDFEVSGILIDNTAKSNTGAIGIAVDQLNDSYFRDIIIQNCETGLQVVGRSYFNHFEHIGFLACKYNVRIQSGSSGAPNENRFYSLKTVGDGTSAGVADYPVRIEAGNSNHFIACSFEDFKQGVYVNDIGNHFIACRLESNSVTGYTQHIYIDTGGKNNSFVSTYFSGNQWVDRYTSISDNGAGNSFLTFSTFKDQYFRADRNLLGADDMVYMSRSGSGDLKSVYVAEDTYSASGAPISYKAKGVRSLHKFFSGEIGGVEKYSVDQNGIAMTGSVDNQWQPNLHGLLSWAFDPVAASTQTAPTGGTLNIVALRANRAMTITNVLMQVGTAGSGTTHAITAIYDSSGNLLATSDDQASNCNSTGLKTWTFSSPPSVGPGWFYVGFWATASTTVPAFVRAANTTVCNVNLATGSFRYATTTDTGLTTTAPSTLGTKSSLGIGYWVGVK